MVIADPLELGHGKKLKQQTFDNNTDRLSTKLDPFIGVFRLLSGNNNKS